jgi:hypothetical protein
VRTVRGIVRRSAAAAVALVGMSAIATPAAALETGEEPGPPLDPLYAVLIFGGIPLAVILLVALLVSAPGWTRSGRVGRREEWADEPLFINGPESVAAVTTVEPGAQETGGAGGRW